MPDFFKFYRSKLLEFISLNYYYLLLFVCSEILSTLLLSASFLGVISYFTGNEIIIISFTILEDPIHILTLICCAIFFTIVLKYINKATIQKLLNLSKTKDNYKLLPLNRVFILSITANFITIILLLIILLISFFDFIFFVTLNILFLVYPLLKIGRWLTNIDKDNLVQKTSSHFFVSKNSEFLSLIFFSISLIYCVITHYQYDESLFKYIFFMICSRYFMITLNQNVRLLFVWKTKLN
jgi:hypothetical protein